MINIYYLSILLLLFVATQGKNYERIKDYDRYLREWEQKKQNLKIHDVSNLGQIRDKCGWSTCKYVYYEYKQKQERTSIYNRTVLMVSGMHGNEFLGTHVLLYGFEHFKGAHIIYFPVANPSGFQRQERLTFPQKLDPNRDYPIDGNTDCYQAYSTIVLDHIFRKYSIDVTFVLHNGGNEIGFNWGTVYHQSKSHAEEYEMQLAIAEMMKRVGGSNKELGIQEFKVGTMNQVIYPATGTFDDWAFAASKYPSVITKCKKYRFQPYPFNMTNGLVFLIELGPHNNELFGSSQAVELGTKSNKDGYVSRGIRLLKSGLEIVNPSVSLRIQQNKALIVVKGCSSAQITQLNIVQHINQTESVLLFNAKQPIQVEGTVRKTKPKPFIIEFQKNVQNDTNIISYRGSFVCSKQWQGKGTTFFASNRTYEFNQQINLAALSSKDIQILNDQIRQLEWYEQPEVQKYALYLIILLALLVLMSAIFALLRCICAKKTVQKEQQTQYHQDEMQTGEDLHTARGCIINQNI